MSNHQAFLVIDVHPQWEELRLRLAKSLSLELTRVSSGDQAKELLKQNFFLFVILAETMPGLDLPLFLAEIKQEYPFLPVFITSPRPTVEGAVAAMRGGAQDYLPTPLTWDRLKEIAGPFLGNGQEPGSSLEGKGADGSPARPIITQDPTMLQVLRMAQAVAPTRATLLIQGESGTGKEILARYIHEKSDRSGGPFIAINCAALPEGLLESELFGHEKGAFTGAIMRKLGKFELAQNGSLLLDEISEMHPHLQAKLLRVLQENEIDRVGGRHPVPINVRVMATTNQNINELIEKGDFREDLFYRLQVISLHLPPLRDRRGDVPLLAEFFLQRYSQLFGKRNLRFTTAALAGLEKASWPGNVRQLENAIARGVLLAEGNHIHPQELQGELPRPAAASGGAVLLPQGKPVTLKEMEQHLISQALNETAGNRTHAAKMLGISVRTLRNKLHEYRHLAFASSSHSSQVA
ncbi:MAG: sigma-54 dependent transcriptional regulator [Thermodesulfobacteriota bacterium]